MSLLTNLVSYWALDEASGNAVDAHGANTLTDNNTVTSDTGVISTARAFNAASSERFSIADNTDLSTGDIDFTFSVWVYLTSTASTRGVLGKWATADKEYRLFFTSTGTKMAMTVRDTADTTDTVMNSTVVLSATTWYHVVAQHDSAANLLRINVNDQVTPDTVTSYTGGVRDSGNAFLLGGFETTYMHGRLDECAFWKRVLTAGEITSLYNGGAGLPYGSFGGGVTPLSPLPRQRRANRFFTGRF